ncbi:MAG: hypothetical protein JWO90_1230, partial [Solirubrobacterales bacterium]|nr:hypothetical protein [Solirubrobacterales bacterium]
RVVTSFLADSKASAFPRRFKA